MSDIFCFFSTGVEMVVRVTCVDSVEDEIVEYRRLEGIFIFVEMGLLGESET